MARRMRNIAANALSVLIVAGIGANLAAYPDNTFTVPLFQRYFGASLTGAAVLTGVVVGVNASSPTFSNGVGPGEASSETLRSPSGT